MAIRPIVPSTRSRIATRPVKHIYLIRRLLKHVGNHSPNLLGDLIENGELIKTYKLDYHDGERFPHLERGASKPDLLEQKIKRLSH